MRSPGQATMGMVSCDADEAGRGGALDVTSGRIEGAHLDAVRS